MTLEAARRFYDGADYAAALAAALACPMEAEGGAALLIAAKSLMALGDFAGLGQVIAVAQQQGAPPERSLLRILQACLADGLREPLIALERIVPESSILHPIALYHASCARMMLGDEDGAAAGFNRFRLAMPRFLDALPFGTDDDFNIVFRQGTLVLPPEETAARIAEGRQLPVAQTDIAIVRARHDGGAGPVVLCCADARYIAYFLPRWLAPLAGFGCPIHVHVINPDAQSIPAIDHLGAAHDIAGRLSASTSGDARGTATSYASARFEVVPALLEQLGRPLLALDIDVAATPALAALIAAPCAADFGCFETGRCEPASVHQASVMAFADTAETLAFVRDLAAFCRPKLHQPVRLNWMLDQAALFSVIRLYKRSHPAFRYAALDRVTGQAMSAFVTGLASDAEKHAIKVKSAGLGPGASASGIEDVAWEP